MIKGDTGAQGLKDDEGDTGPQGPSGSGYSADFSTVLLLLDGTQIMTGNLHMNSKKVFSFGNPSGVTDASNSKYVDTISNNKLSDSETFEGDINTNNNRIKNLHTPTSNKDAC